MRGLRCAFGACGAGLLIAVAAPNALAAADPMPSSGEKAGIASNAHRNAAHRGHTAKPAPHQATNRKEHKKELAKRPATSSPAGSANKKLPKQPAGFGTFSLGVETEQNVKPRSIRGGDYDPERDGEPKGYRPPFLGLSLKSPFSW